MCRPAASLGPLEAVLEASRGQGFLGPGPALHHVHHSWGFAEAHGDPPPSRALDLGAGGGVPGLVLAATSWPTTRWVLVEAAQRRCDFLRAAVERLELTPRVEVRQGRAETLGHDADLREGFDLVIARSFGPPAVAAECAAPFVAMAGCVIVSEPPGGDGQRWDPEGLRLLGLVWAAGDGNGNSYAMLHKVGPCPARFSRRDGVPARRPLF